MARFKAMEAMDCLSGSFEPGDILEGDVDEDDPDLVTLRLGPRRFVRVRIGVTVAPVTTPRTLDGWATPKEER